MSVSGLRQPPDFSLGGCLARHPYFSALMPEQLAEFAAQASLRAFDAGEIIFLEGDPSAGLWVIESGGVKVFKVNQEGDEHILHLLAPGDSFNDIAALDGGPNPVNAAALSQANAWVISSKTVRAALETYPALALAVIGMLTGRVRALVQKIEDLTLYSVTARLARFLIQQSEAPSLDGPGVTRAAIAAHLATTPETVSRVLRSLEEAGAIRFDRHRIVILNAGLLRAIALL